LLAPPLPVAPLVPPVHVVDLMTNAGSAVFGAQWRGMEAKIVECTALTDSMPEFKTTYDVEPYAGVSGLDDSDWPVIPATELGARRGGGMISFFWYRTKLTIPVDAQGFDTAGAMAVPTAASGASPRKSHHRLQTVRITREKRSATGIIMRKPARETYAA